MNTKAVAVYVILLVILVALVALFLPKQSGVGSGTTTIPTTSLPSGQNTTSTLPQNLTSSTTTIYVPKCQPTETTTPLVNGNFGKGTYAGWNATGTGFGPVPLNLTYSNKNSHYYGTPWSGYNGTYFATTYTGGTTPQLGNLTSNTFTVSAPYLNFKLISPQSNLLYVQILYNNTPAITTYFNTYAAPAPANTFGNAASTFQNASITLTPLLCDNVQVRLVAKAISTTENQYTFIAATGFYLSPKPLSAPGIIVNQSVNIR